MGQDASPVGTPAAAVSAPAPPPEDPPLLRAEIERTRLELGDTVAALAGKTDVKARAKGRSPTSATAVNESAAPHGQRPRDDAPTAPDRRPSRSATKAQANPVPTAAIAALAGGFLLGRITKRR